MTYQTALAAAQQVDDSNTATAAFTETTTESAVERLWVVNVANQALTAALGHSAADVAFANALLNLSSSLASAQGTWLSDNANVTYTQTTAGASSQWTHQTGLANATFGYSQTEAGEGQTQTQTVATATASFEVATAAGYAAAMTAFSMAHPSPWATQQALLAQARLAWVTAVAPVYVSQQFADAATEYSQDMARANLALSQAIGAANTASNSALAAANATLSAALAQAASVSAGTAGSGLSLPVLPALPGDERLGTLAFQRHGEDDGPNYTIVFSFYPRRSQEQGAR